jgi:hypothetical protein
MSNIVTPKSPMGDDTHPTSKHMMGWVSPTILHVGVYVAMLATLFFVVVVRVENKSTIKEAVRVGDELAAIVNMYNDMSHGGGTPTPTPIPTPPSDAHDADIARNNKRLVRKAVLWVFVVLVCSLVLSMMAYRFTSGNMRGYASRIGLPVLVTITLTGIVEVLYIMSIPPAYTVLTLNDILIGTLSTKHT